MGGSETDLQSRPIHPLSDDTARINRRKWQASLGGDPTFVPHNRETTSIVLNTSLTHLINTDSKPRLAMSRATSVLRNAAKAATTASEGKPQPMSADHTLYHAGPTGFWKRFREFHQIPHVSLADEM